jgi:hypothetical protein
MIFGAAFQKREFLMKSLLKRSVIVLFIAGSIFAEEPAAPQKWTATPIRILETRGMNLTEHQASMIYSNGVRVTLNVTGPNVESVTAYGKIAVEKAVDDAGTNLVSDRKPFGNPDELQKIPEQRFRRPTSDLASAFDVDIPLASPARDAKKIAEVRGHFEVLMGGKAQTVSIEQISTHETKTLEDPTIKAADLKIKILSARAGGDRIELEITGNLNNLNRITVMGADGKEVVKGRSSSSGMGKQNAQYDLGHPLDDTMKLVVDLITGQQGETIPFELKDVPLP